MFHSRDDCVWVSVGADVVASNETVDRCHVELVVDEECCSHVDSVSVDLMLVLPVRVLVLQCVDFA